MLLSKFRGFSQIFWTALLNACKKGHVGCVKLLLNQKGIDINAKGAHLFCSKFFSLISCFVGIFGIYS